MKANPSCDLTEEIPAKTENASRREKARSNNASASCLGFLRSPCKREVNPIYPPPVPENEAPEALKSQVTLASFAQRKPVNISYSLLVLEGKREQGNSQDGTATSNGVSYISNYLSQVKKKNYSQSII